MHGFDCKSFVGSSISLCQLMFLIDGFTGVELHEEVIQHCKLSIAKWKPNAVEEDGPTSIIRFMDKTPNIQVVQGNGLNILQDKGESVVGFDRIYIGAAVDRDEFGKIVKLLSPGGILVGPGE
jgi:hypothetical protein